MESTELMHYGVKGMKWGVRKARKDTKWDTTTAREKNRELNRKQKTYRQAKSRLKNTVNSRDPYFVRKNQEKAEAYNKAKSEYKSAKKEFAKNAPTRVKAERIMQKGGAATAKALGKVGMAYVTDQVFYGGVGTKMAKETIKAMGMATITAYTMARGGYDIKWYDKQGRRVG